MGYAMRTRLAAILLLLGLPSLWYGCSGDEDGMEPQEYTSQFHGTWRVSSGGDNIRYLIFRPPQSWVLLGEDTFGYRGVEEGTYAADPFVIGFGASRFAYLLASTQLTLFNSADTIQLSLESGGPSETTWLGTLVVLDSLVAPVNQPGDIGASGPVLWTGSGTSADLRVFRIRPDSGTVHPIPAGTQPLAVEHDGTNLWVSGNFSQQISRLDPATGAVTATSRDIAPSLRGLAWSGSALWCSSEFTTATYVYNPATDLIDLSFPGVYGDGMTFAGAALYMCKGGALHRCATGTMRAITSYRLPQGYMEGVAWDGTAFWVLAATGQGTAIVHKLFKVRLPV
jgi:hypothetical protein